MGPEVLGTLNSVILLSVTFVITVATDLAKSPEANFFA